MIDTLKLRKTLGWLGMLLPWIVALLFMVFEAHAVMLPGSISATYYVDACITPFMIILGSAGLLLMTYNGYDKQDKIICTLAGIFGLMICLFPCGATSLEYVGTFNLPRSVSAIIHNASAVIFFLLLAYNSIFLFTKSGGEMTDKKKKRNLIYRICGIGMAASFVLLVPFELFNVPAGTWIVEAIALMFFGISWLTKSQCYNWLFKDSE